MTVYRVGTSAVVLSFLLIVSSVIFSVSHVFSGMNGAKWVIAAIVVGFTLFNFISLYFRRLEVEDDEVRLFTVYGRKSIKLSALEEIGVILLKMRAILILSDAEKFVFVSSYFRNFAEFTELVKSNVNAELQGNIAKLDNKLIRKKQITFMALLAVLNIFLVGSAVYNFVNG
ncbi:hypothetical protein EP073_06190 [Geovibrio thiophilus]|uniref:Uncharacterized protein n=1 Tax=Geovibrio thiophilus TaxID=139438 RepID=A0A410JXX6_9BACT|nr:hypothetical protein [Geovibrio thiophilus]QAR33010.1 hypothetical protein EP073_06190 [Geovibrio thiophilus]